MTLADSKLLEGKSETITLCELRARPGDIFMQVQMGKVFTVTRNGKAIATIQKPEMNAFELGKALRERERRIRR